MSIAIEELKPEGSRAPENIERHRAMIEIARRHMGFVAWPTIIATSLALVGVGIVVYAVFQNMLPGWAGMLINSYLFLILFMGVHDALHLAICGDRRGFKWLNDALGWVCGFGCLVPFRGYDRMHMIHHQYTNDPVKDPDYWCKANTLPKMLYRWSTLKWHYTNKIVELGMNKVPGGRFRFWNGNMHDIAPGLVVVTGFWGGWWDEALLLWVAPAVLNIFYISAFFNWLPHHPHDSQERYKDSGVFLLRNPLHWIVTRIDMFQTYHLMHHLFPRIPFYRLEKAFWEMRPLLEAEGAAIHDYRAAK